MAGHALQVIWGEEGRAPTEVGQPQVLPVFQMFQKVHPLPWVQAH